jgi:hypothetical protein
MGVDFMVKLSPTQTPPLAIDSTLSNWLANFLDATY